MIKEKQKLVGNLSTKGSLSGSLSNSVIYVDPIIQEKEVTPTRKVQEVVPDTGYTGLSKVTVKGYVPKVVNKTITSNGVYSAEEEGLDGYDIVKVETSGVDIDNYFDKNIIGGTYNNPGWKQNIKKWRSPLYVTEGTRTAYMFRDFPFDETVLPEVIFPSNEVSLYQMFYNAKKLKEIPWLINITAKEDMSSTFEGCVNLVKLNKINCEKVTNISGVFNSVSNLTDFGGFENIGKAYLTTEPQNYIFYKINMNYGSKYTIQSLINTLNGLYDIKTKGCKPQQLILGTNNLAKLTSEEGQTALSNAQAKGWTIS
jgi:hypothetical protein|nr:MAG TPA: hypothetical protein [Caudoviricetes sp.]